MHDHPAHGVRALEETSDTMEVAEDLARDWAIINLAEEIAVSDPDMGMVLKDIHWLSHPLPRLQLALAEHAVEYGEVKNFIKINRACCYHLGDEKIPEDIHQCVRDASRCLRHSHVGMNRVHHCAQVSGVLEARGLNCPQVSLQEVAKAEWYKKGRQDGGNPSATAAPSFWPSEADAMLRPTRTWPSPTTIGAFSSTSSFQALLLWGQNSAENQPPWKGWWSRLSRRCDLLRSTRTDAWSVALVSVDFGLLLCFAELESESIVRLSFDADDDPISLTHVMDPTEYEVHKFGAIRHEGKVIRLTLLDEPPTSYVRRAIELRHSWTKWELEKALEFFTDKGGCWEGSIPNLRKAFFEAVLTPDDVAWALELYRKEPQSSGTAAAEDQALVDLLEELAFDDFGNAAELKEYKSEMGKAAARSLQQKRRAARADLFLFNATEIRLRISSKTF